MIVEGHINKPSVLGITQPQKLVHEERIAQIHIRKPLVYSPTNVGLLPTLIVIKQTIQVIILHRHPDLPNEKKVTKEPDSNEKT